MSLLDRLDRLRPWRPPAARLPYVLPIPMTGPAWLGRDDTPSEPDATPITGDVPKAAWVEWIDHSAAHRRVAARREAAGRRATHRDRRRARTRARTPALMRRMDRSILRGDTR